MLVCDWWRLEEYLEGGYTGSDGEEYGSTFPFLPTAEDKLAFKNWESPLTWVKMEFGLMFPLPCIPWLGILCLVSCFLDFSLFLSKRFCYSFTSLLNC